MKLIIDIPEENYKYIKELQCYISGQRGGKRLFDTCINSIANGTPLSEKLEAIKAEFEEIKGLRDNPYNNEIEYSVSMEELRGLLDKHIAELKGIVDRIEEPVKKALSELKGENK